MAEDTNFEELISKIIYDRDMFSKIIIEAYESDAFIFMPFKINSLGESLEVSSNLQLFGQRSTQDSNILSSIWLACLDAALDSAIQSTNPAIILETIARRLQMQYPSGMSTH